MRKNTYGEMLQKYVLDMKFSDAITDYRTREKTFLGAKGYAANKMSYMLYWLFEGRHVSKCLPRKKKKKLLHHFNRAMKKYQKKIDEAKRDENR